VFASVVLIVLGVFSRCPCGFGAYVEVSKYAHNGVMATLLTCIGVQRTR